MEEFSAPIVLIIFVSIIGFLSIYITARRRARDFHQKKRKFDTLSGNLVQLKGHVEEESYHWPIYARPLMFTELDHRAQVEFAKAQQSLTDADDIVPLIINSVEPETPVQFNIAYLFKLLKNINTINIGNRFSENINYLESRIGKLESSVKNIRASRYKVESKRREVRKSIRRLKNRIDHTSKKLKSMDAWNAIETHNFSWVVNIADNCHLTAYAQVAKHPDDEQGYLEHALADVFVEVGDFALDCVELFMESQKISRRYELDVFSKLFKESIDFLQSIITMDSDWNGWRKLQRAKVHIDKFPEKRKHAEESLRLFKFQQGNLEKLIKLINELEVSAEIENADALEKECVYYWYSYEERKPEWEEALGVPPRFPSRELNLFQTLLVTNILPQIAADMFIKQSKMPALVKVIGQALERHQSIEHLTAKLKARLQFHKDAQNAVNALLGNQGKATVMLEKVKLSIIDTSPDISDEGKKLVKEHEAIDERARKIRGANFPELETDIAQLVIRSGLLIDKHNLEITKLMGEFTSLSRRIESNIEEANEYINHAPHFDNQTKKLLSSAYQAGWVMLQETAIEKYSWLRNMTNQMRTWLQNAEPFIQQTRKIFEGFLIGKRQVADQFRKTKNEIKLQRTYIERKWGWYRNEALPVVDNAEQSLDIELNEWKRLEELSG
jgi:methyl-accepting chemotaxis protein